jgi:hypothetical protein
LLVTVSSLSLADNVALVVGRKNSREDLRREGW